MSEVIITPEMREDAKKCNSRSCMDCKMPEHGTASKCVEALASLPGVWDGAPDDAVSAEVCFYKYPILRGKEGLLEMKSYSRTLPKSLEDEIAEKYAKEIDTEPLLVKLVKNKLVEMLKEYNERQGK